MQPVIISLLVGLHGLLHLIGFAVAWRHVQLRDFPYTTIAAWGHLDLGDHGARAAGVGWLVAAVLFVTGAVGLGLQASFGVPVTGVAAALSVLLCALGSPVTSAGIIIDVIILLEVLYSYAGGARPGA